MPLDVQLTIYNAAWALLEGYGPFTDLVKPGNRLGSNMVKAIQRDSIKSAPADFPKVLITVAEDTTGDRIPNVFYDAPNAVDYGVPIRLNLEVRITHDKTKLSDQSPVEAAIKGALFSVGPKLGIPWVTGFTYQGINRRTEKSQDTGGTERTIARMRLVVTARPKRSLLIAT